VSKYSVTLPAATRLKTGSPDRIEFRVQSVERAPLVRLIKRVEQDNHARQYRVTIEPVKRLRTTGRNSQNTYINGAIQAIAEDTGNDFADVKLYIKRKAMRRGYPAKTTEDGEVVTSLIDGEPVPVSEADATVDEAKILIEEVQQLAAELGILLPE